MSLSLRTVKAMHEPAYSLAFFLAQIVRKLEVILEQLMTSGAGIPSIASFRSRRHFRRDDGCYGISQVLCLVVPGSRAATACDQLQCFFRVPEFSDRERKSALRYWGLPEPELPNVDIPRGNMFGTGASGQRQNFPSHNYTFLAGAIKYDAMTRRCLPYMLETLRAESQVPS
jgi:hypothetical protein